MSEIRNRFKKEGGDAAESGVMVTDADVPDVDIAELNNVVDGINNDLDKLVESADKRNESLNEMTKSMYVSDTDEKDNESEGQEEQEEDTDESKGDSEADDEEDADDESDDESDDEEEQEEDADKDEESEGSEEESEESEESEKSDKHCHTQTRIIFVPVRQKEDDGIPGLITGVATLLLFAWAMRALCLICAIGTECYPKSS
jgi:hypothetical protein